MPSTVTYTLGLPELPKLARKPCCMSSGRSGWFPDEYPKFAFTPVARKHQNEAMVCGVYSAYTRYQA